MGKDSHKDLGVDPGIERRDIEMRAVRIKVEPFDFISYLELELSLIHI